MQKEIVMLAIAALVGVLFCAAVVVVPTYADPWSWGGHVGCNFPHSELYWACNGHHNVW